MGLDGQYQRRVNRGGAIRKASGTVIRPAREGEIILIEGRLYQAGSWALAASKPLLRDIAIANRTPIFNEQISSGRGLERARHRRSINVGSSRFDGERS